MTNRDPGELDIQFADESSPPAWGVEIEFDSSTEKSVFRSAKSVTLDGEHVQIELLDGTFEAFHIQRIRKVLSMRATVTGGYTDEDVSADELY